MDIEKLLKKVMEDQNIKGIPLVVVCRVILSVFEAIGSGECFYEYE